eukprot:TRINITY_DN10639_c0_g1_i1.p1 TRINITY_DN10639_c0_g1~~TRINITY_DN10639_c0_g1_i1.p1  ORF type:complete len:251 (-),score=30.54 TRINITY_DN10639_c0_g1_i1:158-910(-)
MKAKWPILHSPGQRGAEEHILSCGACYCLIVCSSVLGGLRENRFKEGLRLSRSMRRKELTFGDADYWEERYRSNAPPHEWYQSFEVLQNYLGAHVQKEHRILVVGCGDSTLSQAMFEGGYENICNNDISESVIDQMRAKHPHMRWDHMDVMKMTYADASFDAVIDKGTFDAIMCGATDTTAHDILSEVYRVLAPGGVFVLISNGKPIFREDYFEEAPFKWTLSYERIERADGPDDEMHRFVFMYIAKKPA